VSGIHLLLSPISSSSSVLMIFGVIPIHLMFPALKYQSSSLRKRFHAMHAWQTNLIQVLWMFRFDHDIDCFTKVAWGGFVLSRVSSKLLGVGVGLDLSAC
jgi:hypothetical protein